MIIKVYSVYDSKIESFAQPFFFQKRGQALRAWQEVVNDESTQFSKHPEDFTLFELGEFDDEKGLFLNNPTPVSLGLALEFRNRISEKFLGKSHNLSAVTEDAKV